MSNNKTIKFYFDYISHNAYIAWTQIGEMAQKYNMMIEPVPVLFAGLLKAHSQLGPAEVPAKLNWMTSNVLRKAALLNIPLNPPASHPFNPLLSLRASLIDIENDKRHELITRIFNGVWVEGRDVTAPEVMMQIFESCGLNGQQAMDECNSQTVKAKLIQNTNDAVSSCVFGVPSMAIGDELFWGYDDFPYLELFLKGEDPIEKMNLPSWGNVKPSAQRRKG